jgi:(R,R)-butanediol dehydrogenase / meso-butanediol dehydrogenase / diacetyl reductase
MAESRAPIRAARFHGPGDVRIEEAPHPRDPGPGELLLRPVVAGICGSDALEYHGGPVLIGDLKLPHPVTGHVGPLTLGHEFSAQVVAVGEGVTDFEPSMLIACGAGISCGQCPRCLEGRTNLCVQYATIGFHEDGGLAELCLAPATACIEVGSLGLSARDAALAQPMAIAVHAARRGRIAAGEHVLVIGAGAIGAFLTYAAAQSGATVTTVDLDRERLVVAETLGAKHTINLSDGGSLADVSTPPVAVFEVSGTSQALVDAVALSPRGTRIILVGIQKASAQIDLQKVTLDELELIGTVAHVCSEDLPEAARLLAARPGGWSDVAPVLLPLDRLVDDGLVPLASGASPQLKTLFDPQARI